MALSDPALAVETLLRHADLADVETLVREVGWNQTAADWRIFLQHGTTYAVRTSGGRVVATTATLPYGDRFGWISMVLVRGEYRRRGLATRLLQRGIDGLAAARLVPVLDATPAGREVYRGLGFEDTWSYHRLVLRKRISENLEPSGRVDVRPIEEAAWPAICAYDAAAFGADRSAVLSALRDRLPAAALFAQRKGRIAGLLLGRDGLTANQLGPLIAEDDGVAQALLARALDAVRAPIYLDLADVKAQTRAWVDAAGFIAQRPFARMLLGRRESFDDAARTFAVVGPEFG